MVNLCLQHQTGFFPSMKMNAEPVSNVVDDGYSGSGSDPGSREGLSDSLQ